MGGKRPRRGAPAKRSVLAGLAVEGAGIVPRRHPAEFGVRPLVVVQHHLRTPTGIFRELLYPWHPWCALHVSIHEAIGKSNDLVFRCTLSGSDASRSVEIPAWMFDRAACGEARLTAVPYVSAAALSALRDLLRRALKDPSASSSALLSGVSRTSRDQNRREAHACQENGTPDEADGQSARPSAAARPVRRRSPQDNSEYASMAGTAGRDPGNADRSDGAADPGACRREPGRIDEGGRS